MAKQLVLTKENIPKYFKETVGPNLPWKIKPEAKIRVEEITKYTNVNFLFRIYFETEEGKKSVVLKQALPFVKVKPDWKFEPIRNFYEQKALKRFAEILGPGIVPEVYFHDGKNWVNVLEDVNPDHIVLADEFDQGRLRPEIAPRLGEILGTLHGKTYGTSESIRDEEFKRWFLLDFKLVGAKKISEELTENLFQEGEKAASALLWGDSVTKNITIEKSGAVHITDFEGVITWDPAFDLGQLVAHYILKLEEDESLREMVKKCVADLIRAYQGRLKEFNVPKGDIEKILVRSNKYLGSTTLHRLKGLSQFGFDKRIQERIKQDGLGFLSGEYTTISQFLEKKV